MALHSAGQDVALKTNVIDLALLDANLGIEVGIAPKWTLDVPASINFWKTGHNRRWKHWAVQPGARYWFCERFGGHFVGMHLHGGQYNIGGFNGKLNFLGTDFRKLENNRYQGWFIGGGISYGYSWMLAEHWNLDAEIGIGYSYTRYDSFRNRCGNCTDNGKSHNYFGPTKTALNIVYLF